MILHLAYLDLSTGSFVLQALVGGVMAVSFVARNRIASIVSKFKKGSRADGQDKN